jgi:hypothetical protein
MPHSATITAKTGPNAQNTAVAYPDIERFEFDFNPNTRILRIVMNPETVREYDLTGVTTVTCTVTSGNFAFVVS